MKIFHHNDADGRCAAAIVLKAVNLRFKPVEPEFMEMDYARPVPFDTITPGEEIVLVDFSFKPADMAKVLEITKNVTWIDHHATAKDYDYQQLPGLRDFTTPGLCGAELAWKYCFGSDIPAAVTLLGDYDTWRMQLKPQCLQFYEGLKLNDTHPTSDLWDKLIEDGSTWIPAVIDQGKSAILYRDIYCGELRKAFGYPCMLTDAEHLTCYALNAYRFGSQAYAEKMQEYDICIAYISDGENTTCSIYSENPNIDVGQVAKLFGGGGHKGAAGFIIPDHQPLPFIKIGMKP